MQNLLAICYNRAYHFHQIQTPIPIQVFRTELWRLRSCQCALWLAKYIPHLRLIADTKMLRIRELFMERLTKDKI